MTIETITRKILSLSRTPDKQGDIIPADAVTIEPTLQVFCGPTLDKYFVGFCNVEKKEDGIYVTVPKPTYEKFKGKYFAPTGFCLKSMDVNFEGKRCRLIQQLRISSVAIAPGHVDPTVAPIGEEDVKRAQRSSKDLPGSPGAPRRRIKVRSADRGSSGADRRDPPLQKKPRFKRKRDGGVG